MYGACVSVSVFNDYLIVNMQIWFPIESVKPTINNAKLFVDTHISKQDLKMVLHLLPGTNEIHT